MIRVLFSLLNMLKHFPFSHFPVYAFFPYVRVPPPSPKVCSNLEQRIDASMYICITTNALIKEIKTQARFYVYNSKCKHLANPYTLGKETLVVKFTSTTPTAVIMRKQLASIYIYITITALINGKQLLLIFMSIILTANI